MRARYRVRCTRHARDARALGRPDSPYHKPELDPDQELILYCQSGRRSALATAALVDMGVERVAHGKGGFGVWKKAGLPGEERGER